MVTDFTSSFGTSNSSVTLSYNFAGSGSTVDKHLVRARKDDFEDQVNAFKEHYGGEERHWTAENAVVGVWFGVNDIRRSFSNNKAGDLITSVMVSYFEKLEMLYIIGLRKFVLLSVPRKSQFSLLLQVPSHVLTSTSIKHGPRHAETSRQRDQRVELCC
jgi:hypothetical protein